MAKRRRPPSQGWKTFLHNHADDIASIGLFVVPTISFRLLYGLLILRHARRELLWLAVTAHPTGRVDRAAIDRGHRLAQCPAVPGAGSGPCLRERLHPAHSCYGHSGSPDLGLFALAEWICGEADRLHPT
jgi:hypothetical protein